MMTAWMLVVAAQTIPPKPVRVPKLAVGAKTGGHCILTSAAEFAGFLSCIDYELYLRYFFSEKVGVHYSNFRFVRESYVRSHEYFKVVRYQSHSLGLNYRFASYFSGTFAATYGQRHATEKQLRFPYKKFDSRKDVWGFRAEANVFQLRSRLSPELSIGYLHVDTGERSHFLTATVGMTFNVLYFGDKDSP